MGMGDPGYKIDAEFNDRSHQRGVLSMARSQDPNSGRQPIFHLPWQSDFPRPPIHDFGKLIKGDDVLEKIANDTDTSTGPAR